MRILQLIISLFIATALLVSGSAVAILGGVDDTIEESTSGTEAESGETSVPLADHSSESAFYEVKLEDDSTNFTAGESPDHLNLSIDPHETPGAGDGGGLAEARFDRLVFHSNLNVNFTEVRHIAVNGGTIYEEHPEADGCRIDPADLPSFLTETYYAACLDEDGDLNVVIGNVARPPTAKVRIGVNVTGMPAADIPSSENGTLAGVYDFDLELFTGLAGIDYNVDDVDLHEAVSNAPSPIFGAHTIAFEILPADATNVRTSPSSTEVVVNETAQFDATLIDEYENPISGGVFDWDLPDDCGTLDVDGSDTAQVELRAGNDTSLSCTLTATETGGFSDAAQLVLLPGPIEGVGFNPEVPTVTVGGSLPIEAVGLDEFGNPISGLDFIWEPPRSQCGNVSPVFGATTTFFAGTIAFDDCAISAEETASEINGTVLVEILPAPPHRIVMDPSSGETREFSADDGIISVNATVLDAHDNPVPGQTLHWQIHEDEDNVGELDPADPVVTDDNGTATMVVESEPTAGNSYRVEATVFDDEGDPILVRTSGDLEIIAGAFDAGQSDLILPADWDAGNAFGVTVILRDQFGNRLASGINETQGAQPILLTGPSSPGEGDTPVCNGTPFDETAAANFQDGEANLICTLTVAENADFRISEVAGFQVFFPDLIETIQINPSPSSRIVWEGPSQILVGECQSYTLRALDDFGNPQPEGLFHLDLRESSDHELFFSDSSCNTQTSLVEVEEGSSSGRVYFETSVARSYFFVAETEGLQRGTMEALVNPGEAIELDVTCRSGCATTDDGLEAVAGQEVKLRIRALDSNGNVVLSGEHRYHGEKELRYQNAGTSPFGDAPVCLNEETPELTATTFSNGVASSVPCTFYDVEELSLVVRDPFLKISGALEINVIPASFSDFELGFPEPDHRFVERESTHTITAFAFDAFGNPRPDQMFYAWLMPFGENQGEGSIDVENGITNEDGEFNVQLSVSNESGDSFRVKFSPVPDPSGEDQDSGQFQVAETVITEGGSIQQAVDEASRGAIILVTEGFYTESVTINTEDLWLIAEGEVVIWANDTVAGGNSGHVLRINGDGVTVEGFHLERVFDDEETANDSHTWAVRIQGSNVEMKGGSLSVINDGVSDSRNSGFLIHATSSTSTQNVVIQDIEINALSRIFWLLSESSMNNVQLSGNVFRSQEDGIELVTGSSGQPPTNVLLEDNLFDYDPGSRAYFTDFTETLDLNPITDNNAFQETVVIDGNSIVKG